MIPGPQPEWAGVIRSGYALARGVVPGASAHGISDGSWSLIQAIRGLLDRTGPADLVVATWTAAHADIAEAEKFLEDGRVRSMRMIVDRSFQNRQPAYCEAARAAFGDAAIRVAATHAKFVLVLGGERDFADVLLLTSANLNKNPRLENYSVFAGGALVEQYAAMVERLFGLQAPGQGFRDSSVARPHTWEMFPEAIPDLPPEPEIPLD